MISLSLLPPTQKASLQQEHGHRQRFRLLLLLGAGLLVMTTAVFAAQLLLSNTLRQLNAQTKQMEVALGRPSTAALERSIRAYHQPLAGLPLLRHSRAATVADVIRAIPDGVTLTVLTLSLDDATLTIEGAARDRPTFLKLQDALRALSFIEDVVTPISSLAKPGDLTFSLQTNVNLR